MIDLEEKRAVSKASRSLATGMPGPIGLIAALSLAVGGPAAADPGFQAELENELHQLVKPGEPGIATCVVADGEIAHQASAGLADLEKRTPMTADTPVYIASVGKEFTAVAILKLVEENRLSLDDPISDHLPGLPDYLRPVTIRHLLTHTSNVPEYDEAFDSRIGVTNADVLSFLKSHSALSAPAGSKWSYSNVGYVLLAELFAAVSGEQLDNYVTRTIFEPLGMADTFFATARTRERRKAVGYKLDAGRWVKADYGGLTIGPGGIYSSANDLCRWGVALDSGKVLKRMTLIAAFTPHVHSGARPTPMGLGYQVEDIPEGPLKGEWYAALFGIRGGFRAVEMKLKSRPFRYVQLSNSGRELEPMRVPNLYFGQ